VKVFLCYVEGTVPMSCVCQRVSNTAPESKRKFFTSPEEEEKKP
jgi:hypothetical protein